NAAVQMELLARLCKDEDVNVRLALTDNTSLPSELLELLAADENPYVQYHARRALELRSTEPR
ncbi:MAG: hypothetical protein SFV17_14850, partial [Candidatus Obscuribacter sp.]|nr:hypothetical protein [Candidatus Obscuribacter sp.]